MASNNRHDIDAIIRAMERNHYYLRDADKLLVRSMLNERRPGIHVKLENVLLVSPKMHMLEAMIQQ